MSSFSILLKTELIKRWRLKTIVILAVITVVLIAIAWILTRAIDSDKLSYMSYNSLLDAILSLVVPFWVLLTTGGMIRFDIKDHWLRTLLSRPVKREIYISSKFAESLIGLAIGIILLGLVPTFVFSFLGKVSFEFEIGTMLIVILNRFLDGAIYIAISLWLSCWLPSYINVIILAGWMFLEKFVIQFVLTLLLFTNKFLGVVADFFFPTGFDDATKIILSKGAFPLEEYLWGFATLFFFLGLAYFFINKIKIDSSAD